MLRGLSTSQFLKKLGGPVRRPHLWPVRVSEGRIIAPGQNDLRAEDVLRDGPPHR